MCTLVKIVVVVLEGVLLAVSVGDYVQGSCSGIGTERAFVSDGASYAGGDSSSGGAGGGMVMGAWTTGDRKA